MNPEMQISINLTPKFEQDVRTGKWIAFIEEFPQAIGAGNDVNEAAESLIDIFKIMTEEREYDIKQQIVEKYMGGIHFNNLKMPA